MKAKTGRQGQRYIGNMADMFSITGGFLGPILDLWPQDLQDRIQTSGF